MKHRTQLEILNSAAKREPLKVVNADDTATVYVYDYIGGWDGVQAGDFVQALNALTAAQINLRINSPGGSVFDGRAMATAVANHQSRITAYVDGIAASAASWLALAADEVAIAEGAFIMIHNAQGAAYGDKRVMLEMAGVMEQIDDSLVADYVGKTGKDATEIRGWMDAETWFNAEDSVTHGFADRVEKGKKAASNAWNLSLYNNTPEELKQPPKQPEPPAEVVDLRAAREHAERTQAMLERIAL